MEKIVSQALSTHNTVKSSHEYLRHNLSLVSNKVNSKTVSTLKYIIIKLLKQLLFVSIGANNYERTRHRIDNNSGNNGYSQSEYVGKTKYN